VPTPPEILKLSQAIHAQGPTGGTISTPDTISHRKTSHRSANRDQAIPACTPAASSNELSLRTTAKNRSCDRSLPADCVTYAIDTTPITLHTSPVATAAI
jgi:hypothetical protein